MDDICRLCCSTKFVNNYIFDEENALFLKMSMYLPIKVFKNDRLPKKICDKCSCKVNDFYQFCNETIEVENRLRKLLSRELTITIKRCEEVNRRKSTNNYEFSEQSTQTEDLFDVKVKEEPIKSPIIKQETDSNDKNVPDNVSDSDDNLLINIKKKKSPIIEQETDTNDENVPHNASDSDDILLINIKKGKKLKKKSERNGHVKKQIQKKRDEIKAQLLRTGCKKSKLNLDLVNDESDDDYNHLEEIEKEMFYCCICLFKCEIRIDMLQHYKTHVDQTEKLKPPSPPPLPAESRCDRCQKIISDPKSWKSHWQRHWTQDRRPYHCSLCEKSFKGHRQILEHGLTHKLEYENPNRTNETDKRFVCDLCPKGFVYMRYLWAHRRNTHPNAPSRELRCNLCSRTFLHDNSFRRHLRSHSGVRDYLCNVCGKAFASPEHLKFHIRMHTGYKPNICKTCGKGFGKKDSLTMHERVHSGEKPYVCSHCGKAFSQRSTLVIHGRSHSGARPYKCGRCGRGFVAQGLLTMHLKTSCLDLPPPTARKTQSRKVKRVNVKLLEKS